MPLSSHLFISFWKQCPKFPLGHYPRPALSSVVLDHLFHITADSVAVKMGTKQSLSDNIHVPGPHSFWVLRFEAQYFPLCVCVLVCQSCPTLCDPMDCNLPGSSVHEILQARIQECVAISFSRGSFEPRSPELQADSLPSEPPGSPLYFPFSGLNQFEKRDFCYVTASKGLI